MAFTARLLAAFRRHKAHYLAEAVGIACFVGCAGVLTILLEHPASPLAAYVPATPLGRRLWLGLGMGLVVVGLVYSPWGQRSGAHLNPAVTLGFWQLGKLRTPDALWYVLAQLLGAVGGAWLLRVGLGAWYAHPAVNFTVTQPKPGALGTAVAFGAELVISFGLMLVLLLALHHQRWKKRAGWLLGALLAFYITLETPLSGMSLNPARSLGTAVAAGSYTGVWVYLVAPPLAMWLATVFFRRHYHGEDFACAVLAGCGPGVSSPHSAGEEPPVYPEE